MSPVVTSVAPATSRRPVLRGPGADESTVIAVVTSAQPIGTLTNRIDRQPSQCVRTPPAATPAAAALDAVADHTRSARKRRGASTNVVVSRLRDVGARNAPPTPWTARAAISQVPLGATP